MSIYSTISNQRRHRVSVDQLCVTIARFHRSSGRDRILNFWQQPLKLKLRGWEWWRQFVPWLLKDDGSGAVVRKVVRHMEINETYSGANDNSVIIRPEKIAAWSVWWVLMNSEFPSIQERQLKTFIAMSNSWSAHNYGLFKFFSRKQRLTNTHIVTCKTRKA